MPRFPRPTEADRLEAFIHALTGNLRRVGIPMPDLDLAIVRKSDADTIAASAAYIASKVHEYRGVTVH